MRYLILFILSLTFIGCGGSSQPETSTSFQQSSTTDGHGWYTPHIDTTWQWQLSGAPNISYDVKLYDLDLFDTDTETIKALQQDGKRVICYFSAGSYENWRGDADQFPQEVLGNSLDGWEGEKWLNIASPLLHPIMQARLDLAKAKGCDGVEPDNIDGYSNNSGFALSDTDQLNYNKFLAYEAHLRGLSIGLKNDLGQITELEPFFDFAVNEQCHQYNECDLLRPFIDNGKPVFNAEYQTDYRDNTDGKRDLMCADARMERFQTLVLPLKLDDSYRISCN